MNEFSEWENWLLYYSVPVFNLLLKDKQVLRHWLLLVESMHICLSTDISFEDLNNAHRMLHVFVSQIESLYSLKSMTYNVHQLLHIVKSIDDWGPFWSHSTFSFEAANHILLKAIHSSKGVILQILRYIKLQRFMQLLEDMIYPDCCESVKHYCETVLSSRSRKILKISKITYFGHEKTIDESMCREFYVSSRAKEFHKIVFNGCLFQTSENKRSCNCYGLLKNGTYVKFNRFVVDVAKKIEKAVCQIVKRKPNKASNFIKAVMYVQNRIVIIPIIDINRNCIFMCIDKKMYIVAVPNSYHY